ncbi:condensation domain-containing protein, partial [Dactylosporangium fulvum]|uniref:condensation domain-containing protein n=1 Tax=Dactylosporangium fulvum TaxID=53359 RepID=UPI0031E02BF8
LLPPAMLPGRFVALPQLPLLTNAKIDRRVLEAIPLDSAVQLPAGRSPRNDTERRLVAIWADLFTRDDISVDDDFFGLGGHSLLAMRLVGRIRAEFGVEMPVRALFEAPTVAGVAERLAPAAGGAAVATDRPPLVAAERPVVAPLSFGQQRLWFLHRLSGPSSTYNMALTLRVTGELDRTALRAAFDDLMVRHEVLRTTVEDAGDGPRPRIAPLDGPRAELTVVDIDPDELEAAMSAAGEYEFDLAAETPLRVWLFALAADVHVMTIVMHHVAGDAWSVEPLARDLAVAYSARRAGAAPDWVPLPVQYTDYAIWQRKLLGDERDPGSHSARQVAFWQRALAGLPAELALPTDRPRPAEPTYDGAALPFEVPAAVHAGLERLARDADASVFMV